MEYDFIKNSVVKKFLSDTHSLRSSKEAINGLDKAVNEFIAKILGSAAGLAQNNKRKTVMEEDISQALEKTIGQGEMSWEELRDIILKQNPTSLGNISKAINEHISRQGQ